MDLNKTSDTPLDDMDDDFRKHCKISLKNNTSPNMKESSTVDNDDSTLKTKIHSKMLALKLYTNAVEEEKNGHFSIALKLYRQALRQDPFVERAYEKTYFSKSNLTSPIVTAPVSETSNEMETLGKIQSMHIESGDPSKPNYIASLPNEILTSIFAQTLVMDLSMVLSLCCTCKKFYSLVHGEQSIWRTVTLETHKYIRQCGEFGLNFDYVGKMTEYLTVWNNWKLMFLGLPRVRFDGCYISVCSYIRPGVSETFWDAPCHLITYFRYCRLYPDGTCLNLLTTDEPKKVVKQISRPVTTIKGLIQGSWRISDTGRIRMESRTNQRHIFYLELQLRNTTRNRRRIQNELVWVSFACLNQETHDRMELDIKHDKGFFFSRVKSYGSGY